MAKGFVLAAFVAACLVLPGCDKGKRLLSPDAAPTYSSCLQSAVASGKFGEKELTPSNYFTRCYDKEKKEYEANGIAQATRLAKLNMRRSITRPARS